MEVFNLMKQRIVTALVALIVFIPIVIYGNWPFTALIYMMATIGLCELMRMRNIPLFSFPSLVAILLLWVVLVPKSVEMDFIQFFDKSEWMMLFILIFLTYTVFIKNHFTFEDIGFVYLATLYVGMGFFYFLETRLIGLQYVFFVLFVVWATDTGAYFIGKAIGKNKLWPEISPNKTIEGAVGGVILATAVGVIFHFVNPFSYSVWSVLSIAVLISVFGQIGDLVESAYKRHFGVKDSGNILPGHGGILDRFDSLLFVFPMLYFVLHFFH